MSFLKFGSKKKPEIHGIFSGCNVCLAGKFSKPTADLITLITDNGGKVSTSVTRKATHFVTTAEEIARNSTKVLSATKHGVPMVTEDWIHESLKKEGKQKADKYLVTASTSSELKKNAKSNVDEDDDSDEDEDFNEEEKDDFDTKGFKEMREKFLKELSSMINDETFSDMIIIAGEDGEKEKTFFSHKAVVCTHSSVLKNLALKSEEKQNGKIVIRIKLKVQLTELLLDVMYTGRADPPPSMVFPLLAVCEQYGLETYASWLRISLWTTKNVCLMYEEAVKRGKSEEIAWCQRIIEKRTEKAFCSDTFTALTTPSLIKLLDSNKLRIDELTLFECLIEWADAQPDETPTSPKQEAVDEELQMQEKRKRLLGPVIHRVRFPLIKADDLYRYVEPYKVVPSDLLLEAYRYYATKSCDIDDIRTTPRGHSTKVKWMSYSHMKTLRSWLPKGYNIKAILFSAERDGFKNATFHEKCNNKGPTLTVICANDGYVFGGFTTKNWTSIGNYVTDTEAFIFSLTDGKGRAPVKMEFNNTGSYTTHSIYDYSSYGPTFGGGHDLYITLDAPTSSYSNLGYTYKMPTGVTQGSTGQSFLAGKYNQWTIKDCIVFALK